MKDSTKDKREGAVHDAKGTIKEKIGHATNNPNLEDKGTSEKAAGKIQKKVGDVEKVFERYEVSLFPEFHRNLRMP